MPLTVKCEKKDLEKKAGEALSGLIFKHADEDILLLLSGGSSLSFLEFAELPVFASNISITMLDERFSQKEDENNFLILRKTGFYKRAAESGAEFLETVPLQGESAEKMGERLDARLKAWKKAHPKSILIATIGIGEDCHLAGMMPYPESSETFARLFEDKKTWIKGYDSGGKNAFSERVTSTVPVITDLIKEAVSFAKGEKKKEPLQKILSGKGKASECPALLIHKIKSCVLYTDQDIRR